MRCCSVVNRSRAARVVDSAAVILVVKKEPNAIMMFEREEPMDWYGESAGAQRKQEMSILGQLKT